MSITEKFNELNKQYAEDTTKLFVDLVKFLYNKDVDIAIQAGNYSDDQGGNSNIEEIFFVEKSLLKDNSEIIFDKEFDNDVCKFFHNDSDKFDAPESLILSKVSLAYEYDCSIINYFVTHENGSLERVTSEEIDQLNNYT